MVLPLAKRRSRLGGSLSIMELTPGYGAEHPADHQEVIHEASLIEDVHALEVQLREAYIAEKSLYEAYEVPIISPWVGTVDTDKPCSKGTSYMDPTNHVGKA